MGRWRIETNANSLDDPTSITWALWQGSSCLPVATGGSKTCTLGGYPSYVVNVSNVAQIQLAVNFVRNTGIRLVVKNTGHDFAGKSAGAGALSIWTHHLKEMRFWRSIGGRGIEGWRCI